MLANILKNDDTTEIYCIAGKKHVENFHKIFKSQKIFGIEGINHCVDVSKSVMIEPPVLSPVLSPDSPDSHVLSSLLGFLSKSSIKRKSRKSKSSIKRKSRKSKSSIKRKSRKSKSSIKRKSRKSKSSIKSINNIFNNK